MYSSHAGLNPQDFPRLETSDPKLTRLRKVVPTIRSVFAQPLLVAREVGVPTDPFDHLDFSAPTEEMLAELPHWAKVAFAGRCAQLALPGLSGAEIEEPAEVHFSAVEQAAAFPARCAAVGQIVEPPPLDQIQFGVWDGALRACVAAALTPFGASAEDTASMAAIAADYAQWSSTVVHEGSTRTEGFQFVAKTNSAIWSAWGKLYETSVEHGWTDKTRVPETFFADDRASRHPVVFLCHAKEDAERAKGLFRRLRANDMDPWLDKYSLVLGDDWELEIKNAVLRADAFVVCIRAGFDDIGFRQKEIRWALDALDLRPPGRGFIIPYRLEPCALPKWLLPFHAGDDTSQSTFEELLTALKKHTGTHTQAGGMSTSSDPK